MLGGMGIPDWEQVISLKFWQNFVLSINPEDRSVELEFGRICNSSVECEEG